jgi:hypothetical protein
VWPFKEFRLTIEKYHGSWVYYVWEGSNIIASDYTCTSATDANEKGIHQVNELKALKKRRKEAGV